jgi:hypothetical protein
MILRLKFGNRCSIYSKKKKKKQQQKYVPYKEINKTKTDKKKETNSILFYYLP